MICPKCRRTIYKGDKYCRFCGNRIDVLIEPVEKENTKNIAVIILASVAIILLGAVIIRKTPDNKGSGAGSISSSADETYTDDKTEYISEESKHTDLFIPSNANELKYSVNEKVSNLEEMLIKYCSCGRLYTDWFLEFPYENSSFYAMCDSSGREIKRFVYGIGESRGITAYEWDYDSNDKICGFTQTALRKKSDDNTYEIVEETYVPVSFYDNRYLIDVYNDGSYCYSVCKNNSIYVCGIDGDNIQQYNTDGTVLRHIYYWEAAGKPVVKYDYDKNGAIVCSFDVQAIPAEFRQGYTNRETVTYSQNGEQVTYTEGSSHNTEKNEQNNLVEDSSPSLSNPENVEKSSIPASSLADGWYELCAYGDQITDYNGYSVAYVDVLRPAIVPDNEATAFCTGDCFSPSKYGINNMSDFIIDDLEMYDDSMTLGSSTMSSELRFYHHPNLGGWVPVTENGEAFYIKGSREYIVFTSSSTVLDEKTSVNQSGQFNRVKINSLRDYFNGYWNNSEKIEVTIRNGIVAEALIPYSIQTIS